MLKIACIIPTYNAGKNLSRLLTSIELQTIVPHIYIVDSSSSDGSTGLVKERVKAILVIDQAEFNHGKTRQMMVSRYPDYDIYIYLTQDTILFDQETLSNLVAPFRDFKIGAVCGRQIPHLDASLLARHARYFNYPKDSVIKSIADVPTLGIKAAFMSNSFAAYRRSALVESGGFPSDVIFAEDMYVAAKMLIAGWSVAYAGSAKCYHSHNYTLNQEFSRYFDMGVFHKREPWIREIFGGPSGEGVRFIKSELKFLGFKNLYLWPVSILRNFIKLLGFKLGLYEDKLSVKVKQSLSMNKRYWRSLNLID